ncbi:unnamed protein product [Rodentolepis nana]|uniref:SAM-dependent methyltransferase n=1 Tax=Rodentolepis nana TaxID=102285 RepID=A0A0R3TJ61_RODNA|nr:unnamed protein product [Rodentolepis nana]
MLRRIATATKQSPFVITYFEYMELRGYPAFLLSGGCGTDLFDLSVKYGGMSEEQAKFYAYIKPENILLYHTGHIMIADFDIAIDQSERGDPNN